MNLKAYDITKVTAELKTTVYIAMLVGLATVGVGVAIGSIATYAYTQ